MNGERPDVLVANAMNTGVQNLNTSPAIRFVSKAPKPHFNILITLFLLIVMKLFDDIDTHIHSNIKMFMKLSSLKPFLSQT